MQCVAVCCSVLQISYLHILQIDSITTRTSGVFVYYMIICVYYMIKCVYYIPYILCYIYNIRISYGAIARLQVFLVYMCGIWHMCILYIIHSLMYISYIRISHMAAAQLQVLLVHMCIIRCICRTYSHTYIISRYSTVQQYNCEYFWCILGCGNGGGGGNFSKVKRLVPRWIGTQKR